MKRHAIHIAITAVAVLLGIGHFVWPDKKIDAKTLGLLVVAILPWLGSVFKSLELPSGRSHAKDNSVGEYPSRGASMPPLPIPLALQRDLAIHFPILAVAFRVRAMP